MKSAPWFVLVAGINGAGKSTFSQNSATLVELLALSSADSIEVLNPDTITRAILKEHPELDLAGANRRAADQCDSVVRERIEAKHGHFVVETVLASDKYKGIVERAQNLGWNILFVYVALASIDESVSRVATRVGQGGHDVPEAKIRKRWPISFGNLPWFWLRVESSLLFLNPPRFGSPKLLAAKQEGWTRILLTKECPHAVSHLLEATAKECGV